VVAARVRELSADLLGAVLAVVADDPPHEVIARPLPDERREADDQMRVVSVADEREPTDAGNLVLAARTTLDQRRVEVAGERAEAIAVEVEAADLAAERIDHVSDGVAGVEREALHRVEVDVEA